METKRILLGVNVLILTCALSGLFIGAESRAGQLQLSRPKAEKPLPNPMIIGAARDEVVKAAKQMLETREIPLEKEDCNPTSGECVLISKSVTFVKGIPTKSQLEHYCDVPTADVGNWSKGRYVLRIVADPASQSTAQVGVYAKFEGYTEGVSGSDWVPLTSKGELEDKLLRCLAERVKGGECKEETEEK